jgi:hypothetical protein
MGGWYPLNLYLGLIKKNIKYKAITVIMDKRTSPKIYIDTSYLYAQGDGIELGYLVVIGIGSVYSPG